MTLQKPLFEKALMLMEPGPVLLIMTNGGRKSDIMTITWHMILDFTPQIALTTGPRNHSFQALRDTKECVLVVPTVDPAEKVVVIGDCPGAIVDKFRKFGLTPLPGLRGKAPSISECLACLECRVLDYVEPYGIFILQGIQAWMDLERRERRTSHANGDGTFRVNGKTLCLRSLMEDKLLPGIQRTAAFLRNQGHGVALPDFGEQIAKK